MLRTGPAIVLGIWCMSDINRGSRWWKFDFHTHTPHSIDTPWAELVGTSGELTPVAWLQKFMEAGIDCVAVTDHNGGDWIDPLKNELDRLFQLPVVERPVWYRVHFRIFPGVELSVNSGLHLLAIFAPEKSTETINRLLALVGYKGAKGDPETRTEKSPVEVARIIHELDGICIPAHVDKKNGLFHTSGDGRLHFDHQTVLQLLQGEHCDAIEVTGHDWQEHRILREAGCILPQIVGTDCHSFRGAQGPGSAFTWIKMGRPSFEGLRLALIDGSPLSVCRDSWASADRNPSPELVIEDVSIASLQRMGRPDPARTGFSPWLNSIIGGRGTGKSTIIDCLRIVFDRVVDLTDALKSEFREFDKIAVDRRSRGAMLAESRIVVHLRKATTRFRLTWTRSAQQTVIETEESDGSWRRSDGAIRDRFPVRILSQKEMFEIAGDPQSLINMVDTSPEFGMSAWREHYNLLAAQYRRLVGQQRELTAKTAAKSNLLGELEDVRAAIAIFEQGDNRQTLQDFQIHRRQERVFDRRFEELDQLISILQRAQMESRLSDPDDGLFDSSRPEHADAVRLLDECREAYQAVVQALGGLIDQLGQFRTAWRESKAESLWQRHGMAVTTAFETLVRELADRGVANAGEYAPLLQKRQQIEQKLSSIAAAEQEILRLSEEIQCSLGQIDAHRQQLTANRSAFLAGVLAGNDFVRVSVIPWGDSARQCETSFREAIGRSDSFNRDILSEDGCSGVLAELYAELPESTPERSAALSARIEALKRRLIAAAQNNATEGFTQRFNNHLQKLSAEDLDRILLWYPEDSLEVQYRRGRDWVPIEQGSPGQKTAAILAFLMSHGREPLILDQPEDDLDNHLIYDLIVNQLRESKQRRQIIVATHNANIVVNGDAEMVIAMTSRGGQCVIDQSSSGALQETAVRREVCNVMEGGRDAFLKRYRRIVQPDSLQAPQER